jgi:hypothetical protein
MCEFLERRALPLAELRRPAPPRDDSHVLMDALRFVDAPMLVTAHPAILGGNAVRLYAIGRT